MPAYQVTTAQPIGQWFAAHWRSQANPGPYEHTNGDLYAVIIDRAGDQVTVWRSTNAGVSWSEQDAANAPATLSGNNEYNASVHDSGKIYSAYRDASGDLAIGVFDLATNTWDSSITGGPVVSLLASGMVRRSDGTFVIGVQTAQTPVSIVRARFSYVICDPTGPTWTGPTIAMGDGIDWSYYMNNMALGDSDRVHFFAATDDTTYGGASVVHRSLSSADVLDTLNVVDDGVFSVQQNGFLATPCVWDDGGTTKITVATLGLESGGLGPNGEIRLTEATSQANPTWTGPTAVYSDSEVPANANESRVHMGTLLRYDGAWWLFVNGYDDSVGVSEGREFIALASNKTGSWAWETWARDAGYVAGNTNWYGPWARELSSTIGVIFNEWNGGTPHTWYQDLFVAKVGRIVRIGLRGRRV